MDGDGAHVRECREEGRRPGCQDQAEVVEGLAWHEGIFEYGAVQWTHWSDYETLFTRGRRRIQDIDIVVCNDGDP